jgi:hypothetical protein
LRAEQRAELRSQLGVGGFLRPIYCQMGRCQRCLNSERPAASNSLSDLDSKFERPFAVRRNLLNDPKAARLIRAPMVARQHVPHGVAPTRIAHEPYCRAATWESAMGVFVLAEPNIGGCDPDVGSEDEFMCHVPRVAVSDHDERFGQILDLAERIQLPRRD